jgi:hypothetical protein
VSRSREMTLDPDMGFNKSVRQVTTLMKAFYIGMGHVPIEMFRDPDVQWRDRPADPKRVLTQAENILETTLIPTHGQFVIVHSALYAEHVQHNFTFVALIERCEDYVDEIIQCLAGNHTRLAILNLFKRFRKNPSFHTMFGKLFLFPEKAEVIVWLRVRGKVDNRILSIRKNSFIDDTQTLHYHAVADVKRFGLDHISQLSGLNVDALKSTFVAAGHAPPTVGSMWQLAKREGIIWDLLEQIFTGQVESETGQKALIPLSGSKFCRIGGVNDDALQGLLEDVISGTSSLGKLNGNCIFYKMQFNVTMKVCKEISKCVHQLNLDNKDNDDYEPIEEIKCTKTNVLRSWERVKILVPGIAAGGHIDRFSKVYISCPAKSQFGEDFKDFCQAQFDMFHIPELKVFYLIIC